LHYKKEIKLKNWQTHKIDQREVEINRKILLIALALSFTISACSNLLKPVSLYPLPLMMDVVSETAKASTSKQLESEALQYEILTDQQALIISTNQGLVFTFDSGIMPFTAQYNDALLGILPDTILNAGQAQLSSNQQAIFLSSVPPHSINEPESLILYCLKANNGEQLWTKTLRGIKHQDVNQKSFKRAHHSTGIYIFNQDKKQLIFFSVSGIEKVFSFSISQPCTASFYLTSKNLYLLLSDYSRMAMLFKVTENGMVQNNSQKKLNQ
jgi:hypothetical protein